MNIIISTKLPSVEQVEKLYRSNQWSSAEKVVQLHKALKNSHSLVTAWLNDRLVGLGNALSDGHLVVYYPHLLVDPEFHGKGIGKKIFDKLRDRYKGFHMQTLIADAKAISFYKRQGFNQAGKTMPMWIYEGEDH